MVKTHKLVAMAAVGALIGGFMIGTAPPAQSAAGDLHVTNQQELLAAVTSAQVSGEPTNILFDNDIQVNQTIDIPSGTTITVTGPYKLEMTADLTTICVEQGASLTIDGIDVTTAAGTTGTGLVVDGSLTLASGSITNNVNDNEGFSGGVTVNAPGSFTMTGGTISGNTAGAIPATITDCGGGGVRNDGVGATFTLTGGTISGNTAAYSGGGVCNANGATFVMDGGEITGNVAQTYYGGGVTNTLSASFTMNSGAIDANTTVLLGGGGVFNNTGATFTLNGGDLHDNIVGTGYVGGTAPNGGGVYNGSTGIMNMTGGNVFNNTGVSGGGVFNGGGSSQGIFNLSGGTITANTASIPGGGVYNGGIFTMTAGEISGNTGENGGGVYNGASMTMSGGTITGNTALYGGGGISNVSSVTGLVFGGTATVASNTLQSGPVNNVTLPDGLSITLGDGSNGAPVPDTMSVGVTTGDANGVIVASGASASDTAYFVSDVPGLSVLFDQGHIWIGTRAVSGVTLDQTTLDLAVGDSATLVATVQPSDATNQQVTWASDDDTVASVDASGTVIAHSVGTATITVTTGDGNFSTSAQVTVSYLPSASLESILVTTQPTTTSYTVGDSLDLSGLAITATYSNGTTKDVTDSATTVPTSGTVLNTPGTQTVQVSFTDNGITETATFQITITAPPTPPAPTLESITVTTPPTTVSYTQGDHLDLSGMVVTATYSDGSTTDVTGSVTTTPTNGTVLNTTGSSSVQVSYTDNGVTKTATFQITVTAPPTPPAPPLESIAVTTPPTTVSYTQGDHLDLSGMVVTATYSDGSTTDVTGSATTVPTNGTVLNTTGSSSVQVSYTDNGITKTTTFQITTTAPPTPPAPTLESITVTTPPTTVSYTQGDQLDLSGMVVTATYSDGSTTDVTGSATTTPTNGTVLNTTGTSSVTVTYTDAGVTKTATFQITISAPPTPPTPTLESITVTTPPTTVSYTQGDHLDLSGMKVTATYSDATTVDVTNSAMVVPGDGTILSTAGLVSVQVSFTDGLVTKTTTINVTVTATPATATVATVSPVVHRGDTQTVTGSGWQPGESVHLTVQSTLVDLGSVTANANGMLPVTTFTVPTDFEIGMHTVTAVGSASGTQVVTFEVQAAETGSPSGPGPVANTGGSVAPGTPWGLAIAIWAACLIVLASLLKTRRRG